LANQGIEDNLVAGNKVGAATKLILVAESYLGEGSNQEAAETARRAYEAADRTSQKVLAALVAIAAGEPALAREVSESLGKELQPQSRAYGLMIEGALLRQEGEHIAAIDKLRAAIDMADLWLIRYQLGRAYFDAGFLAESGDEFRLAGTDRQGEATAVFLDDVPTYRYLAELPYWLGRSEEGLGMTDAAKENFMKYVAIRTNGGPLVDDARQRAGQ
jgi:tetratricopeptide (TPR) repeat protein